MMVPLCITISKTIYFTPILKFENTNMILFHDTISFYCQERLTDGNAEVKKYYDMGRL